MWNLLYGSRSLICISFRSPRWHKILPERCLWLLLVLLCDVWTVNLTNCGRDFRVVFFTPNASNPDQWLGYTGLIKSSMAQKRQKSYQCLDTFHLYYFDGKVYVWITLVLQTSLSKMFICSNRQLGIMINHWW